MGGATVVVSFPQIECIVFKRKQLFKQLPLPMVLPIFGLLPFVLSDLPLPTPSHAGQLAYRESREIPSNVFLPQPLRQNQEPQPLQPGSSFSCFLALIPAPLPPLFHGFKTSLYLDKNPFNSSSRF